MEYLEGLTNGNGKMLTAKLVEIQELRSEYMACVESFKEACDKLEAIKGICEKVIKVEHDIPDNLQILEYHVNGYELALKLLEVLS